MPRKETRMKDKGKSEETERDRGTEGETSYLDKLIEEEEQTRAKSEETERERGTEGETSHPNSGN